MEQLTFGWIDYVVFSGLICTSIVIGIYFAFFSKQDTVEDFLYGGKVMTFVPVAISTLSSVLSGITFLGLPTEVYLYGSQYFVALFGPIVVVLITNHVFLPVYFKLQLLCLTEYLELRFSKAVRKLCSIAYLIALTGFSTVIIYTPALAFSQLTGVDLHILTPILTAICIFYTSMGGLKAMIWADTFQFMFTLGGAFVLLIIGISSVGGLSNIWQIADEGGRLVYFNMSFSFFERCTFWSVLSSCIFNELTNFSASQKHVQKLLSINREKDARRAVILIMILIDVVVLMCILLGLAMYAKYHGCDPVTAGQIDRVDQMLPFFVMDVAGTKAGLPGIFLAGLITSGLATLSATLSTMGNVIYDDFLKQLLPESYSDESKAAKIIKVIIVIVGIVSTGLIFLAEKMGTIFELAVSFFTIIAGPILGLFILGVAIPWVGNKGALAGGYSSLAFMVWMVLGTKWHTYNGRILYEHLPISVEACTHIENRTISSVTIHPSNPEDEPLAIFQISILYYSFLGTSITVVFGLIVSLLTKEMDLSKINPDHVAPFLHGYLPTKEYSEVPLEIVKMKENKSEDDEE